MVLSLRLMEERIALGRRYEPCGGFIAVVRELYRMTHGFHEAALITDSQAYTLIACGVDHASGCEVTRPSPTLPAHLTSPDTG